MPWQKACPARRMRVAVKFFGYGAVEICQSPNLGRINRTKQQKKQFDSTQLLFSQAPRCLSASRRRYHPSIKESPCPTSSPPPQAPRLPTTRIRSRPARVADRKSTRLNSSHLVISYAVFCLKKKKKKYSNSSLLCVPE